MANWLNLGEMLKLNARKYPETVCLMDAERTFVYPETNRRVNRLVHGLLALGLSKGDKISVLMENSIEFVELYLASAKCGLVINPINFRLVGSEIEYIVNHAESRALVVDAEFCPTVEQVRAKLTHLDPGRFICRGEARPGYIGWDELTSGQSEEEPEVRMRSADPWVLLYTSGTTGRPKGVIRSHESYTAFYLINAIDFDFRPEQRVLNIMPLCHVNATFFSFVFTYIGGSTFIHPARGFRPLEVLNIVDRYKISFMSLIPTHYALLLSVPKKERERFDVSSVCKLLCSSAPARMEHKRAIMEWFKGVDLYEGYGSTEAGIVTTLMPAEQLTRQGSIGRESLGTDSVKILDDKKQPVLPGTVGEIYSRGPMMFEGYFKDEEKTGEAFAGEWFSAGDMGYQDENGYFYLVDRKNNLIITGGENVYPSEVESVICSHPGVFDCAVIGLPDDKWGESICAVVVPSPGFDASGDDLKSFSKVHLAGYKVPKSIKFITADDMPRTATGKILHRILREQYSR